MRAKKQLTPTHNLKSQNLLDPHSVKKKYFLEMASCTFIAIYRPVEIFLFLFLKISYQATI